jgi:hypothetical protein
MPTLFLHMGAGKTGTSALQVAFAQNTKELERAGVLYPSDASVDDAELGKITSGNGLTLARYANPDSSVLNQIQLIGAQRAFDRALKTQSNLLYSSEFFQNFKTEPLKALVQRAAKAGYETKIIFYIRSIAGHAASVYSQTIKRQKSEMSFMEFLEKRYKNHFLQFIQRSTEVVDRKNLLIYNFDATRKNIFGHFLQEALSIDNSKHTFSYPKNVNRSLSPFEMEFMRYLNARFEKRYQSAFVSDALIYAHSETESEFTITPSEMAFLRAQYSTTVDALNEYVIGEKLLLCDSSATEGERPAIQLSEFERSVLSIIAKLVPTRPALADFGPIKNANGLAQSFLSMLRRQGLKADRKGKERKRLGQD